MTGPGQVEQARQMIQAAKDAAREPMIAYRLRHEPFNLTCTEIIRSGQVGKPRVIEA